MVSKDKLYKDYKMPYPTIREFTKCVMDHDKRIGLRMLYKKFQVADYDREKYRKAWELIEERIKNASQEREKPKDNRQEHSEIEERGLSAESGSGDSDGQSREEQETKEEKTIQT